MIRNISAILLFIHALVLCPAQAQQSGNGRDKAARRAAPAVAPVSRYQLGDKSVAIPPPSGFAEVLADANLFIRALIATEVPGNEVLVAHLPLDVLSKLKMGERQEYDFYTKVSVAKLAKTLDMSEADFTKFVAQFESMAPQMLDINGPLIKTALRNIQEGLSKLNGAEVQLEFSQPQNLGFFTRTKDVYGMMMLMSLKAPATKPPLLCGVSLVRVNQRLLFVYTYRKFTSEKDAEFLRDFTQEWVKQILAANK